MNWINFIRQILFGDYGGSGGARIDASNCVAAYCPIGAASYAASKVNLANPGTYNAYEGTQPNWTAAGGWNFTSKTKILYSDYLIMTGRDSIIARVKLGSNIGYIAGVFPEYYIRWWNPTTMRFMNNVYKDVTGSFGALSNQTLGMSGDGGCYADGNVIGTLSPGTPTQLTTKFGINGIYLANYDYGIPDLSILALWIYNIALTAQQVSGLTGAINALTSAGNYYL